ncbi:UNVERIFIED_ORG: S-adenosylmethionine:tRNA ribosyltransferase-isomerase [Martelella mediterranea]
MRVDLFDFDLPDENIALRPANPRDSARLLLVRPDRDEGVLEDHVVSDLPSFLRPGDALVFNDTRVIPAQLEGFRHRAGGEAVAVSATLHLRKADNIWHAFARPGKRIKPGDRLRFTAADGGTVLEADVAEKREGGEVVLSFNARGAALDEALMRVGHVPLPPYIASKRAEDGKDRDDYQTVYARENGAVAAPTAGLHFTPRLLQALKEAGVEQHFVTLHVGAGTFLPVKADDTDDHTMHFERGIVSPETAEALNAVKARGGRIVSVGTTSLRLLESAVTDDGEIGAWEGETGIFITPGYRFRAVDMLMTNFHLPKSTLFMLVSAFCGLETMRAAYAHAIESGYRFYSYGDSSLLFRKD